jgi:FixJ family two-component response regulator
MRSRASACGTCSNEGHANEKFNSSFSSLCGERPSAGVWDVGKQKAGYTTTSKQSARQQSHRIVVDDDDGVRRALGALMESVGYVHIAYASALEFLRHYDPTTPGYLVLDIRMHEMSGLELQQELNRRGYHIPVIFVTGHGDAPMAVDAMKKGAFDFVQKPFCDQDLLDRVNRALQTDAGLREESAGRDEVAQLVKLSLLLPKVAK